MKHNFAEPHTVAQLSSTVSAPGHENLTLGCAYDS